MAATDILNPGRGIVQALGFNPNWNYGGPEKPPANDATQRPMWGPWTSRSVGTEGRTFSCTFVDRPIEQVRYIERFYHQFKSGFFTLIDYDNGSREHSVRITSYQDNTHTAHLKYTIRIVCEEVPGGLMNNYPADFDRFSHWLYAVDDWLNPTAYVSGASWAVQQNPASVALAMPTSDPSTYEMYEAGAAVGDFAQVEYVGWGFQMALRMASGLGTVNILLDGVAVVTGLNLVTGAASSATAQLELDGDGNTTVTMTAVPLGRHRVMVQCTVAGNILLPAIQVIH